MTALSEALNDTIDALYPHLSNRALSEKAGLPEETVARHRSGAAVDLTPAELAAFSQLLHVPQDSLAVLVRLTQRTLPADEHTTADKLSRIAEEHVEPLNLLLDQVSAADPRRTPVRYADPDLAGTHARALILFDSPTDDPGAVFLGPDNDSPLAAALRLAYTQYRLPRDELAHWNAVPIADGEAAGAAGRDYADASVARLQELIALMPDLEVVLPLGDLAKSLWLRTNNTAIAMLPEVPARILRSGVGKRRLDLAVSSITNRLAGDPHAPARLLPEALKPPGIVRLNYLENLAAAIIHARTSAGLSRAAVQDLGGPSVAALQLLERAQTRGPRELTTRQLDAALDWPPGTARGILRGEAFEVPYRAP